MHKLILVVLIVFFVSALVGGPSRTAAAQQPGTPEAKSDVNAVGKAVLERIVAEKDDFKPLLTAGDMPNLKEWAACVLDAMGGNEFAAMKYTVVSGERNVAAAFYCHVEFVEGGYSSTLYNLGFGIIKGVKIAVMDGRYERIRAVFIKETLCTRLALEGNLVDLDREYSSDELIQLSNYIDGLATFCLPPDLRHELDVPDYLPDSMADPKAVCLAIERMSKDGIIHPGGVGDICDDMK